MLVKVLYSLVDSRTVQMPFWFLWPSHFSGSTQVRSRGSGHIHEYFSLWRPYTVVVQSPDTAVAVLHASADSSLRCPELWVFTSTEDKLRYIWIKHISEKLWPSLRSVIPGIRSLPGCDSTSAFSGITKKKVLSVLKTSQCSEYSLTKVGDNAEMSTDTINACKKFVSAMYLLENAGNSVNYTRNWLFCHKQQRCENLQPTSNSLKCHTERASFQSSIWNLSLQTVSDWHLGGGLLRPVLMSKELKPRGNQELTPCKCRNQHVKGLASVSAKPST